ncbi:hypothetical protein EXU48_01500 [Occultella glacieicola]|uniref:Uncharacterized protein n=1 Tax=Occultella glacieicola TaxID=2518684 RepID=A0ABY2E8R8_9MICO|nr:hypothetical protein [Occultella glacieicola]TDE98899.1 hypothetical protein EXU48_01500 [Occultella glacieicola]
MADPDENVRRRIRASTLWFVAAILTAAAALIVWALTVGFPVVGDARTDAVAVQGESGRELVVRYTGGSPGCGDPHSIEVEETQTTVTITTLVVAPHGSRFNFGCDDVGYVMYQTIRLERPLAERDVIDGPTGGAVEVVVDVATLVAAD